MHLENTRGCFLDAKIHVICLFVTLIMESKSTMHRKSFIYIFALWIFSLNILSVFAMEDNDKIRDSSGVVSYRADELQIDDEGVALEIAKAGVDTTEFLKKN